MAKRVLQHAAEQPGGELADCPAGQGFTPIVTETAGLLYGNHSAQIATRIMCNRCGTVLEAPDVSLPAGQPGFRGR